MSRGCVVCQSPKGAQAEPDWLREGIAEWIRRDPWLCGACVLRLGRRRKEAA